MPNYYTDFHMTFQFRIHVQATRGHTQLPTATVALSKWVNGQPYTVGVSFSLYIIIGT